MNKVVWTHYFTSLTEMTCFSCQCWSLPTSLDVLVDSEILGQFFITTLLLLLVVLLITYCVLLCTNPTMMTIVDWGQVNYLSDRVCDVKYRYMKMYKYNHINTNKKRYKNIQIYKYIYKYTTIYTNIQTQIPFWWSLLIVGRLISCLTKCVMSNTNVKIYKYKNINIQIHKYRHDGHCWLWEG